MTITMTVQTIIILFFIADILTEIVWYFLELWLLKNVRWYRNLYIAGTKDLEKYFGEVMDEKEET